MLKTIKILLKQMVMNKKITIKMKIRIVKEITLMHGDIKRKDFINKIKMKYEFFL